MYNRNVQDAVVAEAMDVLSQELLVYRYTIAFPEYAFPIQVRSSDSTIGQRTRGWVV
jgi:hypothetical protein